MIKISVYHARTHPRNFTEASLYFPCRDLMRYMLLYLYLYTRMYFFRLREKKETYKYDLHNEYRESNFALANCYENWDTYSILRSMRDISYDLSRNNFASQKLEILDFPLYKHGDPVYLKRFSHTKCLTVYQQCNGKASGTKILIRSSINFTADYRTHERDKLGH
jgi:hypothetical protein